MDYRDGARMPACVCGLTDGPCDRRPECPRENVRSLHLPSETTEPVVPPEEFRARPFHQLKGDNGVVERMAWLTPEQARDSFYFNHSKPLDVGYWVRAKVPFGATEMAANGWIYLRPCEESTPRISWEQSSDPLDAFSK